MARYEDLGPADFIPPALASDRLHPSTGMAQADPRVPLILQIVKAHPDGITTPELRQVLEASYSLRISPHPLLRILRELEHERELYSRAGPNTSPHIWYPNGRLVHPYLEFFREMGGKTYRVSVQDARSGPAVQIQERSYTLLGGERVDGAIFVEYRELEDFVALLNEMKARFDSHEMQRVSR